MKERFLAAVVQITSIDDRAHNREQATALVRRAARAGAELIALPENVDVITDGPEKVARAEPLDGPTFAHYGALARELGIHLLAGTIAERAEAPGKARNTSVLFGPDGSRVAVYRKIHLFDVDLADGSKHRESDLVEAGVDVVDADTPLGRIGLSVCYDLRFPELYRNLSERKCELLTIPAAFTLHTGKDHWEVLIRARAIENFCWVLAPAQTGRHRPGRVSWGHSMIVDPWGTVVAQCGDEAGFAIAELREERILTARAQVPALSHRRM